MKWTRSSLPGLMLLFVFSETISANVMIVKRGDEDISMECDQEKLTIEKICIGNLSSVQECESIEPCNEVQSDIISCDFTKGCFFRMFQGFPSPRNPHFTSCFLITYNCDDDGDEDDDEDSRTSDSKDLTIILSVAAIIVVIMVVTIISIIVCFRRWRTRQHAKQSGIEHGTKDEPVRLTPTAPSVECNEYCTTTELRNDKTSEVDAQKCATVSSGVTPYTSGEVDQYNSVGELNDGITSPIYMDSSDMNSSRNVREASGSSDNLYAKVQRNNKEVGETELHENPAYFSYKQNESRDSPAK